MVANYTTWNWLFVKVQFLQINCSILHHESIEAIFLFVLLFLKFYWVIWNIFKIVPVWTWYVGMVLLKCEWYGNSCVCATSCAASCTYSSFWWISILQNLTELWCLIWQWKNILVDLYFLRKTNISDHRGCTQYSQIIIKREQIF